MINENDEKDRPVDSKRDTSIDHWLAIGAGIGMAVLFFALFYGSTSNSTLNATLGVDVVTVMIIALLWKGSDGVTFVRWTARGVGILWGVIIGGIVIGEMSAHYMPSLPTWSGILTVVTFGGILVGLVLAFFWEGIGGVLLTLSALAIQGDILLQSNGDLNAPILAFVFNGLAFIYCWWRTHRLSLIQQSM